MSLPSHMYALKLIKKTECAVFELC